MGYFSEPLVSSSLLCDFGQFNQTEAQTAMYATEIPICPVMELDANDQYA